jgi:hypothetical protein
MAGERNVLGVCGGFGWLWLVLVDFRGLKEEVLPVK